MNELYVGGVRGFKKTIQERIKKARTGDIIKLNSDQNIDRTSFIRNSLTIDGAESSITLFDNIVGFVINGGDTITFKNLTININGKCNLLQISDSFNGKVIFENVSFQYHKKMDSRDWVTPIASESSEVSISFTDCDVPYVELIAKEINISASEIGNLFSKQSKLLGLIFNIKHSFIDNTVFNSMYSNYKASLNLTDVQSLGELTLSQLVGNVERLFFRQLLDRKGNVITKEKTFHKLFLNDYFIPESNLINLLHLQQSGTNNEQLTICQLKYEKSELSKPYYHQMFLITKSNLKLEDLEIPYLNFKNTISNSTLTMEHVLDNSQWTIGKEVEISKLNSQSQLGSQNKEISAINKINKYIGLRNVKKQLTNLVSLAKMNSERRSRGLSQTEGFSMHMIFSGSAGTGKTTMAKLFGKALYENGILPTSKFILATRKDLVAGYVGQTANKTHELINSARGGVLFIDEAYSLTPKGNNDFAQEAVDQLVADSEEYRDEMVIILAGYTDEMNQFLKSNEGIESRFNNKIIFDNYTLNELIEILFMTLKTQGIQLNDSIKVNLIKSFNLIFKKHAEAEGINGNARFVRNYVQDLITNRDLRLSSFSNLTDDQLISIEAIDIKETEKEYLKNKVNR